MSTQWEDIHRSLGNLPPPPEAPDDGSFSDDPFPTSAETAADRHACSLGDAGEEVDLDDDGEIRHLRARRLAELKQEAQLGRFGSVELLTAADFVSEVNQAGEGVGVVVFLFKERHYASNYMLVILERLAKQFRHVKFLKILYTDCIPNYPDKNLPTLLIYRDDDLLRQLVGLTCFGGSSFGIEGLISSCLS